MKKSNKILLGGFFAMILLITGLHITLYAKYKNGDYIIYKPGAQDRQPSMQSFPNVSIVIIRNGIADISFGDTLSVEKGKEKFLQYVQQGDSLVISGRHDDERFRNQGPVKLILPYNVNLSVFNSSITSSTNNEDSAANPNIFLHNSHAVFWFSGELGQLGHVKLNASDNSTAAFNGHSQVRHLEVQLENSALEYNEGDIGELSIATDSTSRLMIQSKHLLKAKVTSIPNNP